MIAHSKNTIYKLPFKKLCNIMHCTFLDVASSFKGLKINTLTTIGKSITTTKSKCFSYMTNTYDTILISLWPGHKT